MSRLKDLTGQRFGNLVVLSRAPKKRTWTMWNCHCDCGKDVVAYSTHLIRGNTKSCGCKRPIFNGKPRYGNLNPNWLGFGEISGKVWKDICYNATRTKRRSRQNMDFDLDIEYVWNLYLQQERKCKLSGVPIEFGKASTASLDRVNSSIGYIRGNVQWVHKDVNRMKNIFEETYFIDMCSKIAKIAENCEV